MARRRPEARRKGGLQGRPDDANGTVPSAVAGPAVGRTASATVALDAPATPATPAMGDIVASASAMPPGIRTALGGAAALLALLLAFATQPDANHPAPGLAAWGALLLGTGGLSLGLATILPRLKSPPPAFTRSLLFLAIVAAALAFATMLGAAPPGFRPMRDAHATFLGIPPEALWVLVALTWHAPRSTTHPMALVHIAALGLGTLLLIIPDMHLGQPVVALAAAPGASGPALGAGVLLLAAAWWRHFSRPEGLVRRLDAHAWLFAPMLGLACAVGAFVSNEISVGIAVFSSLFVLTAAAHGLASGKAPGPSASPRRTFAPDVSAAAAILAIWLLLKTHGLVWTNTDDNIYFYMANRLGDGVLPHVDYFFAHPPLHVLVPGVVFAIFGFSIELAKTIPLIACAVAAVAIFAALRRRVDPVTALTALVLALFAGEVLKASSNMNGVNLTLMWLALGLHAALGRAPLRAGLFLGAATMTGFYAIGPSLATLAIAFFRPRTRDADGTPRGFDLRHGLRMLAGFALVMGVVNGIFLLAAPETFLDGVYRYHGEKTFHDPRMVEIFGGTPGFPGSILHNIGVMLDGRAFNRELLHHAHLWLGALVLPVAAIGLAIARHGLSGGVRRVFDPRRLHDDGDIGTALHLWLVTFAFFIEFAMFRELYSFYFALLYPLLAAATACTAALAARLAVLPRRHLVTPLALGLVAVPVFHAPVADGAIDWYDGERADTGIRNAYTFNDPPVLPGLAPLIRDLFYSDHRLRGDLDPGYRQYLWTKKRTFSVLEDIADEIRARSDADDTLAGASTLAPAVALLAERRIAADEADTNNKRFRTGLLSDSDYWNTICRDRVRFIIGAPRSRFTRERLDSLPVMTRHFRLVRVFSDTTIQHGSTLEIALYEALAPRGTATTCGWIGPETPDGSAAGGDREP